MSLLILFVIPCAAYAITWWSTGWRMSPDGEQYRRMARGEAVPMPYARRWLLPRLLGDRPVLWKAWSLGATLLSAVLTALLVGGPSLSGQLLAEVLFVGLPGIWRL